MNALDILKTGHQLVVRTLEGFPDEIWERPGACGEWSVKDMMAHLTSCEKLLLDELKMLAGKEEAGLYIKKFMELRGSRFNESEIAASREKSAQAVFSEYNETFEQALELATQMSPEKFGEKGTLPWFGADYTLDDFIVYVMYGHKCEHCARIAAFREQVVQGKNEALIG